GNKPCNIIFSIIGVKPSTWQLSPLIQRVTIYRTSANGPVLGVSPAVFIPQLFRPSRRCEMRKTAWILKALCCSPRTKSLGENRAVALARDGGVGGAGDHAGTRPHL